MKDFQQNYQICNFFENLPEKAKLKQLKKLKKVLKRIYLSVLRKN
tara:strand:+ start:312 stop:446 length:135 start_codon:yes stop_codon:yes gene_type:complete